MSQGIRAIAAALIAALLVGGCGPAETPADKPTHPAAEEPATKGRHPELAQPFEEALIALKRMNEASAKRDLATARAHFETYRQCWEQIRTALRTENPGLEQHMEDGAIELDHEFGKPQDQVRFYEFDEETVKLGRLLSTAADLLGVKIKPELVQKDPQAEIPFNQEVTVNVTLSEHKFTPNTFAFDQHTKVTFVLTNKGKEVHEFRLGHYGVEVEEIAPGKTETVTLVLLDAGEFEFACHVPGHYEVGMYGTIKVKPAALNKQ